MVSFVIPAYNAEKTIKRAIDSCTNQKDTLIEYEIIVVNDGSTDNTEQIINKEYVKIYDKELEENENKDNYFEKESCYVGNGINIIYIKTKNGGLSKARNVGTARANGDYIIYVDSDDYISGTLLKDIKKYIDKNVELIKWSPVFVDESGQEIKKDEIVSFKTVTGSEGFNKLFGKDNLLVCVWDYAIKRDLIPTFPEGRYHEDYRAMPITILKAKSFCSINKYEYYYVQTEKSIMRDNNAEKQKKKLEDILINYDELLDEVEKLNIDKYTSDNVKIFITNALLAVLPELSKENKEFYIEELRKRKISQYIKVRSFKQFIKKLLLKLKKM